MLILLPVMDSVMYGRDNIRRLDKVLEIFNRKEMVSMEADKSQGAPTLQIYIKRYKKQASPKAGFIRDGMVKVRNS